MGLVASIFSQLSPPTPKFGVDNIPDLSGKVVIVTGGNSGLGKETIKALLSHNAKVYIAARNPTSAEEAIKDLSNQTGKDAIFLKCDLGDLNSVKAAAEEFLSKEDKLHVLFNNAGVMAPPVEWVTTQGYDLQFGTNVLGHFYLTKLLLPTLIQTAKESPDKKARVVTTSSIGHYVRGLDFNTFKDGSARRKLGPDFLYCQSKFGNVVFATELARRYGDQGIVSTSVNPGNLHSNLTRHGDTIRLWFLRTFVLYPTPLGALTQLWAGTSPEGAEFNGKYLIPWARQGIPRSDSQDPKLGEELWTWLDEQTANL